MGGELNQLKAGALEAAVRTALAGPDSQLTAAMESLARHFAFRGLVWLWGPDLYRRDRIRFRPLILSHFEMYQWTGGFSRKSISFKKNGLESWLQACEAAEDASLTNRLLRWKLLEQAGWKWKGLQREFLQELRRRLLQTEPSPAQCLLELRKLQGISSLDEDTALELFTRWPKVTGDFILGHLPHPYQPKLWERLWAQAQDRESLFAWNLYRRQVPYARWERDILDLCRLHASPAALVAELERRHPASIWGNDLGTGLLRVVEARGRDVFPYVLPHLRQVWRPWLGRGSFGKLVDLAVRQGWKDLWAGLMRVCATPAEYNQALRSLLKSRPSDVDAQLWALAGVSREWNLAGLGLAGVQILEEETALALLDYDADLLRRAFKLHLQVSPWGKGYSKLVQRLLASQEEELVDFLASRYAQFIKSKPEVEKLADYYQNLALEKGGRFSRRAANVLGQIPPFSVWNYPLLVKENRLARLLFERSLTSYLEDPQALSDLVEAPSIHVQVLAYRVLAQDDPRARVQACQHLPLLLGTLLRPLQRGTRGHALAALANAAQDQEAARRILEQAREALVLPDERYPKEKLVGLIGSLLHGWPELRGPREEPVVYRRAAS